MKQKTQTVVTSGTAAHFFLGQRSSHKSNGQIKSSTALVRGRQRHTSDMGAILGPLHGYEKRTRSVDTNNNNNKTSFIAP